MHIKKITVSNLKTIKDFEQDFQGGVYLVTGENEIGKSTILNIIGTLLTGERSSNLLKEGEEKGFAKITVGEGEEQYEVSLTFSDKNPRGTLQIQKVGSPMKSDKISALQDIFKYQDFDANEFVKWSDTAEGRRKQVAVVKSLLPKEIQERIAEIDTEVETTKKEREPVNQDIKTYQGLVDKPGVNEKDKKTYAKAVIAQEAIDKKVTAATTNEQRTGVISRQNDRIKELESWDDTTKEVVDEYDADIAELEAELEAKIKEKKNYVDNRAIEKEKAETQKQEAAAWLLANPEQDLVALQKDIDDVEEHNKKHTKVKELEQNIKKLETLKKKKAKQEASINKLLADRKKVIKDAKLPIDGLDFDDDGLTLNAVPFRTGEISTSQEMEVAAKLIIAKNPTVKVFRIAQGESLGKKRLQAIVDFANKSGYQGFIEEVHRGQDELIIHEYTEK